MLLIDFKNALKNCIEDAKTLGDGVKAVNVLLSQQGLTNIYYFVDSDEATVTTKNGMPGGVLEAVDALRAKYGRPVFAYSA